MREERVDEDEINNTDAWRDEDRAECETNSCRMTERQGKQSEACRAGRQTTMYRHDGDVGNPASDPG